MELYRVSDNNNLTTSLWFIYKKYPSSTSAAAVTISRNLARNRCLYINDGSTSSNKVLLAMNNIPTNNCTAASSEGVWYPAYLVHMNILKTRKPTRVCGLFVSFRLLM